MLDATQHCLICLCLAATWQCNPWLIGECLQDGMLNLPSKVSGCMTACMGRPQTHQPLTVSVQEFSRKLLHCDEVVPPQAGVVPRLAVSSKAAIGVPVQGLRAWPLRHKHQPEQAPAAALHSARLLCVLAFQADGQVVCPCTQAQGQCGGATAKTSRWGCGGLHQAMQERAAVLLIKQAVARPCKVRTGTICSATSEQMPGSPETTDWYRQRRRLHSPAGNEGDMIF